MCFHILRGFAILSKVIIVKITGIIAEYNPFHAGHLRHMELARQKTNCDYVICVMGGNLTQRGEPAIMDKFARIRCALLGGADAVFELPAVYAARPANLFARGGVDILNALKADFICFGCETDDPDALWHLESLTAGSELSEAIREGLSRGESYPRALGEALHAAGAAEAEIMHSPNALLAVEYLRELKRLASPMQPVPILRDVPYHCTESLFSASGVRALLKENRFEEAVSLLPEAIRAEYRSQSGRLSLYPQQLDAFALTRLRTMDPDALCTPDAGEGLGRRIKNLAAAASSLSEVCDAVKCKRYTRSRVCRAVADACVSLPAAPGSLPYLRLLGIRKQAAPLLKELTDRAEKPLVTSAAALADDPVFRAECRVTDLWGFTTADPEYRRAGREFTQKFITI